MMSAAPIAARARVLIDNDFGGDPDGLFQLAHHLLSPSCEIRGILCSQHYSSGFYGHSGLPGFAVEQVERLLRVMGMTGRVPVLKGADLELIDHRTPQDSDAAKFIVDEAMRDDTDVPLYVACGAGLTSLASAYLMNPAISQRLRLVWIGGPEHDGLAVPPPNASPIEYNLGIDVRATQVIWNDSDMPIWQVPRDAYRQTLISYAELLAAVKPQGRLGEFLFSQVNDLMFRANRSLGEAYALGDSPLVLLTALQSGWEPDPASSQYVLMPRPTVTPKGNYARRTDGPILRVYTRLDTRLMFADLFAKLGGAARSDT